MCFPSGRTIAFASFMISSGSVAEKSSVWRSVGSVPTMRWTSGQKPMSIIRSASSSTSTSSRVKSGVADRMWSMSRPGVATTIETPAFSARSCGSIGTPPYTAALVIFV